MIREKKIAKVTLLVAFMLLARTGWCSAQVAEDWTDFSPDRTEVEQPVSKIPSYVRMREGGLSLMYIGAGLTLSAGVLMAWDGIYHELNPPPQPVMDYAIVFAMGLAGAGTLIALIGLPLMLCGKPIEYWDDCQSVVFSKDGQKGMGAILEAGFAISPGVQLRAALGYHINKNIFLGAGAMFQAGVDGMMVPIYGTSRFSFGSSRVVPYIEASGGYAVLVKDWYCGLGYGMRFRRRDTDRSLWLSAYNDFGGTYHSFGLRIGFSL